MFRTKSTILTSLLLSMLIVVMMAIDGCSSATSPYQVGVSTMPPQNVLTVPLEVVEDQQGSVLALVPAFIQDEGPFAFALDTGASQSLVDRQVVDSLELPIVGSAPGLTGITGSTDASLVRVETWRMGDVSLPAQTIVTIALPSAGGGPRLRGLIGSDVLSLYGAVTVDYDNEQLLLRERIQGTPTPEEDSSPNPMTTGQGLKILLPLHRLPQPTL